MTTGSKLMRALKARYKHPRDVLTRLGLDASLLNDPELESSKRNGRFDPRDHTGGSIVRTDDFPIDPMMRGEKSFDGFDVPESGSTVPRKVETRGPENLGGRDYVEPLQGTRGQPPKIESEPSQNLADDDEPDEFSDFANYCRDCGMSEDQIETVIDGYKRYRRGRGNGHDRRAARDVLPKNASAFSAHGGGGLGGHVHHAMDSAGRKRLNGMFPGLQRIGIEPSVRPLRRLAADAKPMTDRSRARFHAMFPDAARIVREGDVSHAALERRPAGRGKFEV